METEKKQQQNAWVGSLIAELEQKLRSSKENISSQEANVFMEIKSSALRGFTVGLTGGSVFGWLAGWKLPHLVRLAGTAATGFGGGLTGFSWSMQSSANYILSLEGTRMQRVFRLMMLNSYIQKPHLLQKLATHFYAEEVYDDLSDKPRYRLRFRNHFGEVGATDSEGNNDYDTFVERSNQVETVPKKTTNRNPSMKQTQVMGTESDDSTENPFDCIFGISGSDEAPSSNPSNASHRRHRVHSKRYLRRHRRRHTDASEEA